MSKITVALPIKVPEGDFCWQMTSPFEICDHYNNSDGYSKCNLGFDIQGKCLSCGVPKPQECRKLKVM